MGEAAEPAPDNVVDLRSPPILPYFTDLHYSHLLCNAVAGRLIHVTGRGWLAWDRKRWREDQKQAERAAKQLATEILLSAVKQNDGDATKKATGRCAESKIRASLKLAESDLRLSATPDLLDADLDLLNTTGGVVDLRDGSVRDHDPGLLMTKLAGADYDPDWRSERWQRFLDDACGGDAELIGWLQRFAGYAATGAAQEQARAPGHSDQRRARGRAARPPGRRSRRRA